MANGDVDAGASVANPPPDPGAGPQGPPGQPPGPPDMSGSPVLAALSKQQPPVTAPGAGDTANSLMQVKMASDMMTKALPGLAGTPAYREVLRFLERMARFLPQGQPTAGSQQIAFQDAGRQTVRNQAMQKIMQMMSDGGQPGGGPPGGGMGGPPAPMPSTPFPGA